MTIGQPQWLNIVNNQPVRRRGCAVETTSLRRVLEVIPQAPRRVPGRLMSRLRGEELVGAGLIRM